jgi:ABC-type transport system involved in resistance to organic solvents, periplasmic component
MSGIARRAGARRRSVLIGVGLTVVAVALLGFAVTAKNGLPGYLPGVERNVVKIAFDDVGSLRTGDDARIANLRAGYVESIALDGEQAIVTIALDGDRPVYRDASAAIADRSVLGQKYVDLNPGDPSRGELPSDEIVPVSSSKSAQELAKLLNVFDVPTRDATSSTLQQVGGGLLGHEQDLNDGFDALPTILPDLGTVSESLAADDGRDLAGMLTAADRLAKAFAGRQQHLAELTGQLDRTFAAFDVDGGAPLAAVLQKAPVALAETRSALDALRGPLGSTETAMGRLQLGADALGEATPDVRGFLVDGVPPLDRVPGVAESAEPAFENLSPTFTEARPLARQLGTTMSRAEQPLGVLAPYSPEIWRFFTNFAAANNRGDGDGNWLRVFLQFTQPEQYIGSAPVADPTVSRDPYPEPGTVHTQQERSVVGERAGR